MNKNNNTAVTQVAEQWCTETHGSCVHKKNITIFKDNG